ncbi:MAG: GntR family transcriptional regulator [Trueperaceae bacterium]
MREHITEALRTAILAGELRPGHRLTEVDIANQLGTSRAPVREALRQLEKEGFVDILPYRETRVSVVTLTELKEVLVPIRTVVETFALRQLLDSKNSELLASLEAIVELMKAAAEASDRATVVEHDLEFHRVLVQSLKYSHPIRVWSGITPVIYRAFFVGTTAATLYETVDGHVRLLEVIGRGDRQGAEELLREHIEEMELKFSNDGAETTEAATADDGGHVAAKIPDRIPMPHSIPKEQA